MATEKYMAGSAEEALDIINLYELEEAAGKVVPKGGFGYIYSGAGDLYTINENITAFKS